MIHQLLWYSFVKPLVNVRLIMIQYQVGYGLKILFVGINPHPGSYSRGIPYSNNKLFWYLLHEAGLLPETRSQLKNDVLLKRLFLRDFKNKYRLGLLNVVDRATRTASELKRVEALPNSKRILSAIKKYRPLVVCFVGKITYSMFSGEAKVSYGWQPDIADSKIYVMHSPGHGLASVRIEELKEINKVSNSLDR